MNKATKLKAVRDDSKPAERCFYCRATEGPFEEDHVVPFSRGGTSLPRNLVLACKRCNGEKNDMLPSEWKPEPILHERVYELERMLVEWHEALDARRRAASYSLYKDAVIRTTDGLFAVEALDGKGIRLRPYEIAATEWFACERCEVAVEECDATCEACGHAQSAATKFVARFAKYEALNSGEIVDARRLCVSDGKTYKSVNYLVTAKAFSSWRSWSEIRSFDMIDMRDTNDAPDLFFGETSEWIQAQERASSAARKPWKRRR